MLPVHKKTKRRKRTRRSHHALVPRQLISCPQCSQAKMPHTACENCGYVNSHTTLEIAAKES